jgi:hypothetical protein
MACGSRCHPSSRAPQAGREAPSVLATLPPETQIVLGLDFARLRAGGTWPSLRAALGDAGGAEDRALVQAFAARTGFDPFTQTDSLTVAFPENAQAHETFGLVLKGHGLEESRLVAYIRERLRDRGDDLTARVVAGRTLWSSHQAPVLSGAFVDANEAVLGAGSFPERLLELRRTSAATGAGAAPPASPPRFDNALAALLKALGPPHEIWGAAAVPLVTRERLATEPRFKAAASVQSLALAANLDPGLDATVLAELGSAADAASLADEARQALDRAKADPKILLLGLTSFLEGLTVAHENARFVLRLRLSPERTQELLGRVAAWAALAAPRGNRPPGFP